MNKAGEYAGKFQKGMHGILDTTYKKGWLYLVPIAMFIVLVMLIMKGCGG